ncbi:MAG: hypothetical protein HYT64_01985 [Candidatus Yanofskybacteria bacterium]|nr:hypothetical protein [Candidatus Yanofskybacteria bacterium]
MPLLDGQTVVAFRKGRAHDGAFVNVVFVVDDLKRPLHQVIYDGLRAASDAGFKSVSLPPVRMGVMLGVVEKSVNEAVAEMFSPSTGSGQANVLYSTSLRINYWPVEERK